MRPIAGISITAKANCPGHWIIFVAAMGQSCEIVELPMKKVDHAAMLQELAMAIKYEELPGIPFMPKETPRERANATEPFYRKFQKRRW